MYYCSCAKRFSLNPDTDTDPLSFSPHLSRILYMLNTHAFPLAFTSSMWVLCPSVSLRDDVYGPLGSQESAEEAVGLREADGELVEWGLQTQPPAQCCWCLEPGTTACVHSLVQ